MRSCAKCFRNSVSSHPHGNPWRQVKFLSPFCSWGAWGLERGEVTYLGSHNQCIVDPGPKPGSELLDSKTWALISVLKGWGLPGSQGVGTVVWHSGHMPACLQMWVKSVASHSFKERSILSPSNWGYICLDSTYVKGSGSFPQMFHDTWEA